MPAWKIPCGSYGTRIIPGEAPVKARRKAGTRLANGFDTSILATANPGKRRRVMTAFSLEPANIPLRPCANCSGKNIMLMEYRWSGSDYGIRSWETSGKRWTNFKISFASKPLWDEINPYFGPRKGGRKEGTVLQCLSLTKTLYCQKVAKIVLTRISRLITLVSHGSRHHQNDCI